MNTSNICKRFMSWTREFRRFYGWHDVEIFPFKRSESSRINLSNRCETRPFFINSRANVYTAPDDFYAAAGRGPSKLLKTHSDRPLIVQISKNESFTSGYRLANITSVQHLLLNFHFVEQTPKSVFKLIVFSIPTHSWKIVQTVPFRETPPRLFLSSIIASRFDYWV